MFALGAGAALVGRSRYCDYPPEAAGRPVVGGYADPSVEAILALGPTLVVGARGPAGPALDQALTAHGIRTFFPETESLDQIKAMILELGELVGERAPADRVAEAIEARRGEVHAAVRSVPKVRVAYLFGVAPIVVAGPGSFPHSLLVEAAGENVIASGGAYPTVDIERLLAKDPDVLLDGASEAHGNVGESRVLALQNTPGWRDLRALRTGSVRVLSGNAVLRPGPRIGEGLVAVVEALHGTSLPLRRAVLG